MEKRRLTDAVVGIDGRRVEASRTVCKNVVTYEPYRNSGSWLDTNALVYELMLIAGRDMIDVGSVVYGGDYTAVEMAGTVCLLRQFMINVNEDEEVYDLIQIKTATFSCSFYPGCVFEQIAEWEGVAGITSAKAYKFHCEGKEMPRGTALKKYTRCHGYKPTHISLTMNERRINEKFEVLGTLYRNLTSEGMRKAMSVCAAARYFEHMHMDHEWLRMVKQAMRWKLWKDYAKKEDGVLAQPISFSATDFQCGPDCYKVVDDKYVQELVAHVQKMIADAPKPEWPSKGDMVMFKSRDVWRKRKYQGKHLVDSIVPGLSIYGDRIEWKVAVCVGKFECEYFMPGQLEPVPSQSPRGKKSTTGKAAVKIKGSDYQVKSDGRTETFGSYIPKSLADNQPSPLHTQGGDGGGSSIADKLREALMQRLSA